MAAEWKLRACGEFCGVLPDGTIRPEDRSRHEHWRADAGGRLKLAAVRNGWTSFQAIVEGAGEFAVRCELAGDAVAADLYRVCYHRMAAEPQRWLPDGLVPIDAGAKQTIPDPINAVPHQTAQAIWVDLFVAADAKPGAYAGRLTLTAGGSEQSIELALDVLELAYPAESCFHVVDISYGNTWMVQQYPRLPRRSGPQQWEQMIPLIHAHHRMFFEHFGDYHQLGYGHSGATNELFAPRVAGHGRSRHVADWTWYDRHYGPLLDGSAFADCRRAAAPIFAMYMPFSPAWPADYTGWGQKGFDVEFVNCLRDFDAHFRQKGWTKTVLELFLIHKKRFRYFEWDGEEQRWPKDNAPNAKLRELLDAAVRHSPVQWRYRVAASWLQRESYRDLAAVYDFWACGGFVDFYEKEVHEGPMANNSLVFATAGASEVGDAFAATCQNQYRAWIRDFTGTLNWLATGPGKDPWNANDGARTALVYPGGHVGVDGPVPTIRLKLQRNCVQDINLLQRAADRLGKARVKADLTPTVPIKLWEPLPAGVRGLPPHEWTMSLLKRAIEPGEEGTQRVDPLWWQAVRAYARRHASDAG